MRIAKRAAQSTDSAELQLRPIRVATVLRNLQASYVPERAISVGLDVDESLHVLADEAVLGSAIGNLLDNAIKFSRSGGRVVLRCRAEDLGVVIEVEDECGGIDDATVTESFSPSASADSRPRTLGSGLTMAKRAVDAMGGAAYVENRPGLGCTFALLFPPAQKRASSAPPPLPRY